MIRVGLLLVGAWVGVMGLVVHRHVWSAGGVTWPWGLALTLLTTGALVHWAGGRMRLGGAWFAVGWSGVLTLEQVAGSGSSLVAADWLGWTFLLGGVGVLAAVVVQASRL